MAGKGCQNEVVDQLQTALESEDATEKNYHIRQALQLIEVDA